MTKTTLSTYLNTKPFHETYVSSRTKITIVVLSPRRLLNYTELKKWTLKGGRLTFYFRHYRWKYMETIDTGITSPNVGQKFNFVYSKVSLYFVGKLVFLPLPLSFLPLRNKDKESSSTTYRETGFTESVNTW